MTTTAHLSFRRSCATEKSQKTIDRDPSALRFVGMTKTRVTRLRLMFLCLKIETRNKNCPSAYNPSGKMLCLSGHRETMSLYVINEIYN